MDYNDREKLDFYPSVTVSGQFYATLDKVGQDVVVTEVLVLQMKTVFEQL